MTFSYIKDLATTDIQTIESSLSISEAIVYFLKGEHRNIVVTHEANYLSMTIHDVLGLINGEVDVTSSIYTLNLATLPKIDKDTNILETLISLDYDVEHFVAINSDGTLFGLVAHSDILSNIDPNTMMDNCRLDDIIKGQESYLRVNKNDLTSNILQNIEQNKYNSAIVIDNKKPIGIITTKDILRLLQLSSDLSKKISEYMTQPLVTIYYKSTISETLKFMKNKHFKQIVTVEDDGTLHGIITQEKLISVAYDKWVSTMKEYQEEVNLINTISENKKQESDKIKSTDNLTGLYTQIKFVELYALEYQVMLHRHNHMSIMMINLDYFEKINTMFGHNIGDKVLLHISDILLFELRNVDITCRWDADEFVVLLPGSIVTQAEKKAEYIKEKIENHENENIPGVSASFGVTEIEEGETLDDVIYRLEQSILKAKSLGGNSVIIM